MAVLRRMESIEKRFTNYTESLFSDFETLGIIWGEIEYQLVNSAFNAVTSALNKLKDSFL